MVGAGRTGTSVVARVLQERLGVDMGGPGRKHWTNPDGDYEDRDIRAVNRRRLRGEADALEWAAEFGEIVSEKMEPWGFKDPSSCLFLGDVLDALPRANVIWAQRAREDTIRSWMRNYKRTYEVAAEGVDERLRALYYFLDGQVTYLAVDFTSHVEEDALAVRMHQWLTLRGQEGLRDL